MAPAPSPGMHRNLAPRATPAPTTAKPTTAKPTTAQPTAAQPMPTAAPVLVPTPAPTPLICPDTRGSNSAAVLYDADKWTGAAWRSAVPVSKSSVKLLRQGCLREQQNQ
eukprot:14486-Heterococcus_DN1.PRE.1